MRKRLVAAHLGLRTTGRPDGLRAILRPIGSWAPVRGRLDQAVGGPCPVGRFTQWEASLAGRVDLTHALARRSSRVAIVGDGAVGTALGAAQGAARGKQPLDTLEVSRLLAEQHLHRRQQLAHLPHTLQLDVGPFALTRLEEGLELLH